MPTVSLVTRPSEYCLYHSEITGVSSFSKVLEPSNTLRSPSLSPVMEYLLPSSASSDIVLSDMASRNGVIPAPLSFFDTSRNSSQVCGGSLTPTLASRSLLYASPCAHDATETP